MQDVRGRIQDFIVQIQDVIDIQNVRGQMQDVIVQIQDVIGIYRMLEDANWML